VLISVGTSRTIEIPAGHEGEETHPPVCRERAQHVGNVVYGVGKTVSDGGTTPVLISFSKL
jgi:hypothetical protein